MTGRLGQHGVKRRDGVGRALLLEQHIAAVVERVEMAGRQRQRLVEGRQRLVAALQRVQHQREVRQRVGRARLRFKSRGDETVGLAYLAALVVQHAEEMQRIEIVALHLEHARVEGRGLVEAALLMQRDRLLNRLAGIERPWLERIWLRSHSRLVRAMRRVTSAGVAWSAAVFNFKASRAAGRSRQRVSQAFRFGTALKSISMARLMTAATLRSATVNSCPSR